MSYKKVSQDFLVFVAAGIALASTSAMAQPSGGFVNLPDEALQHANEASPVGQVVECTHVLGFSQTADWYMAPVFRSTNPDQPPDANAIFESIVDGDRWQLQWTNGAGTNVYANPDAAAWNANILSPCVKGSDRPERLVYMISGPHGFDVAAWAAEIEIVLNNIRNKFPSVKVIALQPVVGAPVDEPGDICPLDPPSPVFGNAVRASWQATPITEAIEIIAALHDDVVVGARTRVRSCDHFVDGIGHISNGQTSMLSGAANAAVDTGLFYRDFDWED